MSEIEKNIIEDDKLNTSNIFDEFEVDDETKEQLENLNINKNSVYYMQRIGIIFKYLNFLLFLFIILGSGYIYIQKSDSKLFNSKEYLNPICNILLGTNISTLNDNCSGITIFKKNIENNIEKLKKDYFLQIVDILKKSYQIESIKNSKEAIFIIDKSNSKNDPVNILNKFDILKNNFTGIDKQKIKCKNIYIHKNILELECSSYSTAWYSDIPGIEGEKTINTISGTSITLASSFINYISKSNEFSVIDKQKLFEIIPYFGEGNYVYKTDFKLKVKYDNPGDLPL